MNTTEHWDKVSETIDGVLASEFLGFYARKMVEMSQIQPHSHVLDIACGTGLVAYLVEKYHHEEADEIKGVDFSPKMIEVANRKKAQFQNSKVEFLVMDGQDLKFPDASFTNIFSHMGVLFYPDVPRGLKEIHRVLKDGGRAIVSSWSQQHPLAVGMQALNIILNKDPVVLPLSDPNVFEKLMKEAGFLSVQVHAIPHEHLIDIEVYIEQIRTNYPKELRENQELLNQVEQKIRELFNFETQVKISTIANILVAIK
jgi:ubiquinone/menaquinone biosynthesis C-methylase UbiE